MTCDRCSADLPADALWCLSCGRWASGGPAVCQCEEMRDATGSCAVCGTPVCGSCSHEHAGRTFCSDGTHPALLESHTRLGDYVSQFEADWVHRNFVNEGVRSAMFGFRAHPGFYGLILPVEASVFVHKEDEARARSLMERYADEQGA